MTAPTTPSAADLDAAFAPPPTDAALDAEFTWTTYENSCRDATLSPTGDPRECRRLRYHGERLESAEHASGFGSGRVRWSS